jgi:hypothetical protein
MRHWVCAGTHEVLVRRAGECLRDKRLGIFLRALGPEGEA